MNESERWVLINAEEIRLWIPILVGFSALIFSTYQAYRVRRHYALTSRAVIQPYVYASDKEINIGFRNDGPGHGIVDDTALYFDGNRIHETRLGEFRDHIAGTIKKGGVIGKAHTSFGTPSGGTYLAPGEKDELLTVKGMQITEDNMVKIRDLFCEHYTMVFLYHSIYDTNQRTVVGNKVPTHPSLINKVWSHRKLKKLPDTLDELLN